VADLLGGHGRGGRPRRAPRARAASSPSRVPSTIGSRMNSATRRRRGRPADRSGWWCPRPRACA
jgi:hypothetical protein